MAQTKKPERPRVYLSTDCRCGHTYNWHVPGGVCQVPNCVCKKHVTRDESPNSAEPSEETAAEVRRADRDYWVDRDWDGEPDDPSDHYYC